MCATLMVTAVLEVHHGVTNLWQQGNSAGMKIYQNYGKYIPLDYMKAFLHSLSHLWAEKSIGMLTGVFSHLILSFHLLTNTTLYGRRFCK